MSKHVLIFSTNYFPYIGGAEVAIKEITDKIDNTSVEFSLITPRMKNSNPKKEKIGNIEVYRVGFGFSEELDKVLSPFLSCIKAFSINKRKKVDVFWCMMASFTSGGAYIFNIVRFWQKIPIVLTLQEGDSESYIERERRFGLVGLSWRLSLPRSSIVTVISTYLGKRARYFGYKGDVILIPNGVDIERFPRREKDKVLMDELGISDTKKVVITTSRLVEKNGVRDFVEAAKSLSGTCFLIVGDGILRKSLEEISPDNVLFVGTIPQEEIPRYLSVADIFCRPSLSEGQGISFLEAMSFGLPVIATNVGGISDFLFDVREEGLAKATGWVVGVNSPQEIVSAILDIFSDKEKARRVVENAHTLVLEKYNWDNISKEMEDLFIKMDR